MFVSLYEEHKMSDSIHPAASETVFDDIGIAINHKLKVLFESGQPVGTLLVDLMSVAAERNTAVRKNELRLSLCEIITAIKEFIEIDVDDNGVLSPAEYANFVEMAYILLGKSAETNEKVKYYLMKFDGINSTSAAEYMVVVFFMDIEYSQDRLETTQL
ncbi:uncharacterized protein LOC126840137 [Adelges cooleyi]|uniref:uncharacterized protein LOC126840137 n=1 Tax=Adelges cooleyi TaxID=133065 RepID=UPI0021800707|nr:uncharacterized protein LOC126840137 [Adelges cooleyi]